MAEAKHDFVDDYPYLVYTAEQGTLVYSDKANTSIDDIPGGGTTIGSLQMMPFFYTGTIAEGANLENEPSITELWGLMIDSNLLISPSLAGWSSTTNVQVAEGVGIIIDDGTNGAMDGIYIAIINMEAQKFEEVRKVDCSEEFIEYDNHNCIALTMPQMVANEYLLIHYPAND